MNERIIRDEILSHLSFLEPEQMSMIDQVLADVLGKYKIEPISTELAVRDDAYLQDIQEFIVRKELNGLSQNTLRQYVNAVKRFVLFYGTNVREAKEIDIIRYLAKCERINKTSKATRENERSYLKIFFKYLKDTGKIENNPLDLICPIKYERNTRTPLSNLDQSKLYDACETLREKVLIHFLISTGCRVSEASSLNIEDVNFNEQSVLIKHGKGDKSRLTLFDATTKLYLIKYLKDRDDDNPALFVSLRKPHTRLTARGIEKVVKSKGEQIGMDLFPHLLRHTFATNLVEHNMRIEAVSKLLGHANISTTQIYAKTSYTTIKEDYRRSA